jgi:hypothetical protein
MKHPLAVRVFGFVAIASVLSLGSHVIAADAPNAAIPRLANGKPDLSGIWQALTSAEWNLEPHQASKNTPAGLGVVVGNEIPYQPWALEKRQENFKNRATADPARRCFMPGIPRANYVPHPLQIFQAEDQLTFIYEFGETVRTIHANGSKHPEGHIDWWMGDSRGTWDGDTLVVDVTHFNDQTWFDRVGNFHSDAMHVVERYKLAGPDHIEYSATIEDPKVFTRPWQIDLVLYRRKEKNVQLLEYKCYAFDLEQHYP